MPAATRTAVLSPSGSRNRNDLMGLIATAARGDLTRERGPRWSVYFVNGNPRPEVLSAVAQLIRDGLLEDPDPDATHSTIAPTTAGLAKIGRTR